MNLLDMLLLAGADASADLGDKLKSSDGVGWEELLAAAGVAAGSALIIAFVWLALRWRSARHRAMLNSPSRLLHELCAKHALSGPERRLIASLAKQQRLENPGLIFADPRLWDAAKKSKLGRQHGDELCRLRERIFASGPA